jgi:hypothetical protein
LARPRPLAVACPELRRGAAFRFAMTRSFHLIRFLDSQAVSDVFSRSYRRRTNPDSGAAAFPCP